MKKALLPILLVLLLTLAFTSCDASLENITEFMGGFSDNVYIESGMVEANTANAAAVTTTTASIGTGDSAEAVTAGASNTTFGISVTIPDEVTKIIKPQTEAEQEETKDDLATAFASPTQTKQLVDSLKAPASVDQVEAAEGTILLFNATLDKLKTDLATSNEELSETLSELTLPTLEDGEELTQGDVLVLQMMTNLISNTVATLNDASGDDLNSTIDISTEENKEKVLSIVDDALFTAQVAEQLSGAASIDFSGQLDLAALLDDLPTTIEEWFADDTDVE